MNSRHSRARSGLRWASQKRGPHPDAPASSAISLKSLLDGHRGVYGADSEVRLATWLRQDILAALNEDVPEPVNATGTPVGKSGDRWLTLVEAAKRMRLAAKTLSNWRIENRGPDSFRSGGRIYYLESVVENWVEKQSRGAAR